MPLSTRRIRSVRALLAGCFCLVAAGAFAVSATARSPLRTLDGRSLNYSSPDAMPAASKAASAPNEIAKDLRATTCVSTSDCWAVGTYGEVNNEKTLIEHWDGTSWEIVDSPNVGDIYWRNILQSVACSSTSDCWAVGFHSDGSGAAFQTLILHWDGTAWDIVESPNTGSTPNGAPPRNELHGVACSSASKCWAVGTAQDGGSEDTLIERWDGQSWTIISSPNPPNPSGNTAEFILNGVTCVSDSDCYAVGSSSSSGALIEHWDGLAWAIIDSATVGGGALSSVTCTSASRCWAVGSSSEKPVVAAWNGSSWSLAPVPATQGSAQLNGVTCASPSQCWAVGTDEYANGGWLQKGIIEHWDGNAWQTASSPDIGGVGQNVYLYGIACAAESQCWAAGSQPGTTSNQTLIEQWNGSSWTVAAAADTPARSQNISTRANVLTGDNRMIGGFIITGSSAKKVVVRALGRSTGIATALADPELELHMPNGAVVTNDNWKINDQTGQTQEEDIRATGVPPADDHESAILLTLAPGNYTAVVSGKDGGTGIGLVEVYDLRGARSTLANISTRGFVDVDDNAMIGGFIIGPPVMNPSKMAIRALGPSTAVSGALQDPVLELHDGNGGLIATNDNWQDDASASDISSYQLAPADSHESAMIRSLNPGNYTAVVRGANSTTGVGLVEVYNLQ